MCLVEVPLQFKNFQTLILVSLLQVVLSSEHLTTKVLEEGQGETADNPIDCTDLGEVGHI